MTSGHIMTPSLWWWNWHAVLVMGLCLFVTQVPADENDMTYMTYTEGSTEMFATSVERQGCYAHLGSYPHWCLGNLSRCAEGISVTAWLRFNGGTPPSDRPDVLLTSGGDNVNSDGFAVMRKYSDQITVAVAFRENLWDTTFRLSSDSWVMLTLLWERSEGLSVLVDGLLQDTVKLSRARNFNPDYNGKQASLVTGVTDLGDHVITPCSYDVGEIRVANSGIVSDALRTKRNLTQNLFQGCATTDIKANLLKDIRIKEDASTSCRLSCHNEKKLYALVRNESTCACVNEVNLADLSMTGCVGKWLVYIVSHIRSDHNFRLRIDYTPQSKNSYTKPGEDILFNPSIDYDLEVVYKFEFDDGYAVATTRPAVSHSWTTAGKHNVTVSTTIGIVTLEGVVQVDVEDVDEGQAPKLVGITVEHHQTALTAQLSLTVADDHVTSCQLSFGDGETSSLPQFTNFGENMQIEHKFRVCGYYNIRVKCFNGYGTTIAGVGFWARQMETTYHYISSNDNFSIAVWTDQTIMTSLLVTVNDVNVDFETGVGYVKISKRDMGAGVDNVVRLVSDGVVLDHRVVSVRLAVQKPAIVANTTKGGWNATVHFTFTLHPCDHTWVNVDYGNGEAVKVVYVTETKTPLSFTDIVTYLNLGVYNVKVRLYNEISEVSNALEISVEVPIHSLMVSTSNITSLKENVSFVLEVNKNKQGPNKVVFHIEYGDGASQDMLYNNKLTKGFQPFLVNYTYTTWGIYRVKVTASNNISQAVEGALVHVGENMTFLDILTSKERTHFGGALEFTVVCPTGSDVRYTLDFGDGTNFSVGELTGPEYSYRSNASGITEEKIIVRHTFASLGFYNVKVTAFNTFGSMKAVLCPTIAVVDFITVDCLEPIVSFKGMNTSLENPLVRKRSVGTLITVDATNGCPQLTELTYSWKGVFLVTDGTGNVTEQTIHSFCSFKSLNNTLEIKALALPFGLYKLTVTVSPVNNDLVYTRRDIYIKIIQSEPVPIIDGEEVVTIMLYATAIFDVAKSHDPDVTENQRQGLSFHLFFMPEASLKEAKKLPLTVIESRSNLIANKTLFPATTANRFSLYQYGTCFNDTSVLLDDLSIFAGKLTFAADNFVTTFFSFGVVLWVERNNLTAVTSQIVEVRTSNMSLDDIGSLLDLAMNADPDTAIRLCGGAASAILNQDVTSADEQEKLAESAEAVVKTLGSVASRIDSPNQAAKCASAIKTMTSNKGIVSEGSRSSAASAFVSLANGTKSMEEATIEDTSSFAGECLGGLSNIFPATEKGSKTPGKPVTAIEMSSTTAKLLELTTKRNSSPSSRGNTTPFTARRGTTPASSPAPTRTSRRTTKAATTSRATITTATTARPPPTTTVTAVKTTATSVVYHTTVGTTLSPSVRASFTDNGSNYTISGIFVATLHLNASRDESTTVPHVVTTTKAPATTTTTSSPTSAPATIPVHPRMFEPRTDFRTSQEIAEELLHRLPKAKTYDELLHYILQDCLLFRTVLKAPEIQHNCPCISAEAISMMKCEGDFSLQDRVFDIMTYREHPDDLYEVYLVPLNKAKNERDQARKDTDKTVATSGQAALETVADVVGSKSSGEDNTERSFVTSRLAMKLAKIGVNDAANNTEISMDRQTMEMPVGAFEMPVNALKGASGQCQNLNTFFFGDSENPYTFSETESNVGRGVLSLSYSCNGEKVKVEAASEPIQLWIDRDSSAFEHDLFVMLTNTKKDVWTNFNYHPVNITDRNGSLQIILEPQDSISTYYVYVKNGGRPNMTHYDFLGSTPNSEAAQIEGYEELNATLHEQLRYTVTVPQSLTMENGTYWIGVKFRSGNLELEASTTNTSYTLLILVSGCRFWDEANNSWSSEGCQVGPLTTKYRTQCFCDHLTSFGSDAVVVPNTIDFTNVWAKFHKLNENAAVFATVFTLIGLYIVLAVLLRHMDKRDLIKWGALPLEDNLPTDNYFYQVTVQTGIKKNAGTDSQIRFIVSGDEKHSGVRRLVVADNMRKHLPRGSILNYIMSVEGCLGQLTYLRIWHDNSGRGKNKSWYLDHVQVIDLQTGDKFIFICDRWLAVEEDDGMVDRILPVAGIDDLVAFRRLFSSSARKKLTNDHLWVSVFSRPSRSNFTRVQRLSCCMSLLFLTMITNAMWFRGDSNEQGQVRAIKLGPFTFTLSQLFISMASTLIVFPPNFLMITFFRRCSPKNNTISQINQAEVKDKQKFRWKNVTTTSLVWGPRLKKNRLKKLKESVSNILSFYKRNKYADTVSEEDEEPDDDTNILKTRKKKKTWSLPFWCLYVAWALCFLSIVVSGFFTILYSMEWGRDKANQWLTTFLLSFFESVIIIQPIKVLLLVAFIACVLKKPELEEEDEFKNIKEALAERESAHRNRDVASLSQIILQRRNDEIELRPLDVEELARSRRDRLTEIKMEAVLKEIVVYAIFLVIIFFLSYQQRDPVSYLLANNIRNTMLSDHENINTVLDYWTWLEDTFLPSLYATNYANGTEIEFWQGAACVADMENRRVGVARLRQMRVKNDTCTILPQLRAIINHCRGEYTWTNDDTKPYLPYWLEPPSNVAEELKKLENPFVYQNSVKLKNAPYVGTLTTYKGGGYVVLMKRQFCRTKTVLTKAREENWLDLNTKAIFLEYTVYNPNSNLFASVTALTEFLPAGSATSRLDVKVFRLMNYIGGVGLIVLIFEILFGVTTLYFFIQSLRKVIAKKLGYFRDFWCLLEFVLLCFSVTCIVMYAFKHVLTEVAMSALRNRKSDGFVNFNSIAFYDEMYGYVMAVVVFMATIQFLRLLQFNKKMGMLGSTVKLAAKDLSSFSISFLLYFFAFTATGFLLFGNVLATYQNVITAAESVFAFALGSFDYEALTEAQPFWGPVFFFSYIGVVYIGLMNIFLAIIGESFSQVKENVSLQSNDYEIVDFMWKTVKGLFK